MALTKIPANLLDTSSHVDFANNEKLRFGTGSDLQIYSDGTHSRIYESGSGLLIIRAGGFNINNADGSQSYITMSDGGATTLYHAGAAKLATASGGASVTGNLAVSGNLTVSGTTTELDTTNLNVTDKNITLNYHASSDTSSNADGAGITIQDAVNASTNATLNWSAANDRFVMSHGLQVTSGNVGIGTSSPRRQMHIHNSASATVGLQMTNGNTGESNDSQGFQFKVGSDSHAEISQMENSDLRIFTNATEAMRIDNTGKVGIGQDTPVAKLHIQDNTSTVYDATAYQHDLFIEKRNTAGNNQVGTIRFGITGHDGSTTAEASIGVLQTANAHSGNIVFGTRHSGTRAERMRISSDGKVGIGTTGPNHPLSVRAANAKITAESTADSQIIGFQAKYQDHATLYGSFEYHTGDAQLYIDNNFTGNGANYSDINFRNKNTSGAFQTVLKIKGGNAGNNGYVGIGRIDPTQILEVHKASGGDQTVAKFSAHNYSDTGKTFIELGTEYGDGSSRIGSFNDTGNKSVLVFDTHSATSGQFTERMRINSSGNVGINNTECSHKLHVEENGTGAITSLRLANENTSVGDGSQILFTSGTSTVGAAIAGYGTALNQAALIFKAGGDTERMRIDSAGTLFLGTLTHTALHSAQRGIVFENGSLINDITRGNGKSISLAQNLMVDAGNTWVTLEAGEGSYYQQYNGNHYFATANVSGGALVDASPSTLLKIHKTGNDVDFTSNTGNDYTPRINLYSKSSGAYCGEINFYSKHNSNEWVAASIFATGGSGYGTGNPPSGGMRLYVRGEFGSTHGINAISIAADGVASGDFNDTSDVALKKDIVSLSASDSITAIKALNPVSFKWKLDDQARSGFIAQEVETHLPNDVVGEDWRAEVVGEEGDPSSRDEGSKGKAVNSTGILAHAVKVIQEQQKEIDALKARMTTLEG